MSSVAVVSDTTHYIPAGHAEAIDLRQVSLYVHWQGRDDRESDLPDFNAYYDHLRSAPDLPTTSQPSVGDFLACYEKLLDAGHDIVSIHLSAGVSGTYDSALAAKAQLDEQGRGDCIEVMDSATACGGLGLMVLAASAQARAGGDVEAVVRRARGAREQLKMWFCVDTLEFLRRGGRIGAAGAWLGTTLRIKPILALEAEITPVERVRTSKRAFERMVDYLRSCHDDGADAWVVQHIQARDAAERLVERGREIFGSEPTFVSEIGPVIGTHAGPGLIGVGGVPAEFLR
ncbi:MAG TPA: DegV family protein [Solirubrobacteraceae bacterium]|nr:DegV family protein [Solirubrobacteraceae bacterium]